VPRLQKIDSFTARDHSYLHPLQPDYECYYFGEYTGGRVGYAYSDFNKLILNFKKKSNEQGTSAWAYKLGAIETVATWFSDLFSKADRIEEITFVPVPPSKTKNNSEYDDRMLQVLKRVEEKLKRRLDIRELIITCRDREPLHGSDNRLKPIQLKEYLRLNENCIEPEPQEVFLVDDILTNGTHYRAIKMILEEKFFGVKTKGLFIGRRIFSENSGII